MRSPFLILLCASLLCGCDGDCHVAEATGVLGAFSQGCNAGAVIDGDNINFDILVGLGDSAKNFYKVINFTLVGPSYIGRRQTAGVGVSSEGRFSSAAMAHGVVDLIIDGADYSKTYDQHFNVNIVRLEVRDDSTQAAGVFRGSVQVVATEAR